MILQNCKKIDFRNVKAKQKKKWLSVSDYEDNDSSLSVYSPNLAINFNQEEN